MPDYKKKEAEKTEQKKRIEDLRWFGGSIVTHLMIGFISVVEREEWLYDTCNPKESH